MGGRYHREGRAKAYAAKSADALYNISRRNPTHW